MYPILFHLGHLAITTQGVLIAVGLLTGLQLTCSLGSRRGVSAERLWNLGLVGLVTLFFGQRLLIIAFNLGDFIRHPFWMLGLAQVRDERYFYGGAALAICAGAAYISAWRLPWGRVGDALAPGTSLALAWLSLGSLAAGDWFGSPTTARWGVVYTSLAAARTAGTPLGIPLVPVALCGALLYLALGAGAAWLALRGVPGTAAAAWLASAGMGAVLLGQLRYRMPGEVLVGGVYTPAQVLGILAFLLGCAGCLRLLKTSDSSATHPEKRS